MSYTPAHSARTPSTLRRRLKGVTAFAAVVAALVTVILGAGAQPSAASVFTATAHPAVLRFTVPDNGRQPTCPLNAAGTRAVITVSGTGIVFDAVCDPDGRTGVWDAIRAPAACQAAWHFHHLNALGWYDGAAWQQYAYYTAFVHAWHLAGQADPQLRTVLHYYLWTLTRWSHVEAYCGF